MSVLATADFDFEGDLLVLSQVFRIRYPMQALVIDAFAFSQLEEQRDGSILIADLPRLLAEANKELTKVSTNFLSWRLVGSKSKLGYPQLKLAVKGEIPLVCQRCLNDFMFPIDSVSELVLANDEENADEIDALLDDDEIDVVVGSKTFDVIELIEDEVLLAIPQSPKHAICPDGVSSAAAKNAEASKKVSPFAVLKKLN